MKHLKKIGLELYFKYNINLLRFLKKNINPGVGFPKYLYIELTRNCNGYCRMCSREQKDYDPGLNMSLDLFKKIADTIFPYAKNVDLRGFGESTLLPNFLDYVNYALKYDCRFGLITNLNRVDDLMWEYLVKNNFWFGVSFDGVTKETFEYIRKGNDFDNVLHNLKLLVKYFKKYKRKKEDLYLITTVQKNNLSEIPAIVDLASKMGIKKLELNPVRTSEGDANSLSLYESQVRSVLKKTIEHAKKKNVNLVLIGSLGQKDIEKDLGYNGVFLCERPWLHAYITYNGYVGPCNHLLDPPLFFGNLEHGFKDVWNNELFTSFRELINTKHRPRFCKWCKENSYD